MQHYVLIIKIELVNKMLIYDLINYLFTIMTLATTILVVMVIKSRGVGIGELIFYRGGAISQSVTTVGL